MWRCGAFPDRDLRFLLDILASSPRPLRVSELPYEFRERQHGESKLDKRIAWEHMMLIADRLIGHIVPVRLPSLPWSAELGCLSIWRSSGLRSPSPARSSIWRRPLLRLQR